jgi:hypothetical protein
MAAFCSNCGNAVLGGTGFCSNCGAAAGKPVAAAAKGSPALKILVIVLCVLAVGGMAVVGAAVYVAHRVKQAVVAKAAENGVDLSSIGAASQSTRALPKPCTLLSKDEVSRLIGQPIERAVIKNRTCEYYGPAGLSAKLAEQEGSAAVARAKTPGADPKANAIALQRMMTRMGAANGNAEAGSAGNNGELPLLVLGVSPVAKPP